MNENARTRKCQKGALLLFLTTLMIQKTTSVFIVGYITLFRGRFLNLRHRYQSHGHFEHIILVISGWGLLQEKKILDVVNICKKILFYPNQKNYVFTQVL